jgi:hypothetical protein
MMRAEKVPASNKSVGMRTIAPSEVKEWFGTRKARISEAQYAEIAGRLTKWRWPSDPPVSPEIDSGSDSDPERWWDFQATWESAQTLHDSIPAMLSLWESHRPQTTETRRAYQAIEALGEALPPAMPYIQWPFGKYERKARPKQAKPWHMPAIAIARMLIDATVAAGNDCPGITRNSVVVAAVRQALTRMGYPDLEMVTAAAIGAHLTRWESRYGLTPKGRAAAAAKATSTLKAALAALTTK